MEPPSACCVRVLVVDDDELSRAAIAAVLEPLAEVVTARSGAEAVEAVAGEEFAAVLLDIGMAGMDGFETARRLKALPHGAHVPIIFLTGRIAEDEVRRGYELGAVDYLLKPFEPRILQAKVAVFVDLERLRHETAVLSHRSLHDPLTGLPNRTLLLDRLEQALARTAREPALVAVLFLDLDRFKQVNDRLGHDAGDRLLVEVAARLGRAVRATDTAARFGGDEFLVLCEQLHHDEEVEQLAARVHDAVAGSYHVAGGAIELSASIGVASTDDPSRPPEALIAAADREMLRAKASPVRPAAPLHD